EGEVRVGVGGGAPRLDRHLEVALVDVDRGLLVVESAGRDGDAEGGELLGDALARRGPVREGLRELDLVLRRLPLGRGPGITGLRPARLLEQRGRLRLV